MHQAAANDEAPLLDACRFGPIVWPTTTWLHLLALCGLKSISKPVAIITVIITIDVTKIDIIRCCQCNSYPLSESKYWSTALQYMLMCGRSASRTPTIAHTIDYTVEFLYE